MKKRHKSKAAQMAAERDIELYIRLLVFSIKSILNFDIKISCYSNYSEIEDQVIVEEHLIRNAIDRAIHTLFGEVYY